jgi:6,7-dimethyl-8-ribityllumazine synthase
MKEKDVGESIDGTFKKQIMIDNADLPPRETITQMNLRIAIVRTQWHHKLVNNMTKKMVSHLTKLGVKETHIVEISCPGCWEIPYVVSQLLQKGFDAIICLGILIEGETKHFDLIAECACDQLMKLQCKSGVPIVNAVFCCRTEEQAVQRTQGAMSDELSQSLSVTAVSMANVKRTIHFMNI